MVAIIKKYAQSYMYSINTIGNINLVQHNRQQDISILYIVLLKFICYVHNQRLIHRVCINYDHIMI